MDIKEIKAGIAKQLHESALHAQHDDLHCAICGKKGGKLALESIRYTQNRNDPLPEYFVPMSASDGIIRGCFPVCDKCAPPCKKCGLPMYTEKKHEFMGKKKQELQGDYTLMLGYGNCNHFPWRYILKRMIKDLFHIR